MKYIKTFENSYKYNIGDYVICVEECYPEIINYAGEIVEYDGYNYYVKYDYDKLPDYMKIGFKTYGGLGIRPYPGREIVRKLTSEEIAEYKIEKDANKYNL